MQPLEFIYIGFTLGKMQPARDVVLQGRQYTIFFLNAGSGDTNETSYTWIWRWMGYETHFLQRRNRKDDL